jgi:DNA polymerase I
VLFGDGAKQKVVAVELASPHEIELLRREDRNLRREKYPLKLFALLADRTLLEGFRVPHRLAELEGNFPLRFIAYFDSLKTLDALLRHLRRRAGKSSSASEPPYLIVADPVEQYLMLTGVTFFVGMKFEELRRLQLDIETYISYGFEFPCAARESDRIIAIALTDSDGFECVLSGREMDEQTMLIEMVRIIQERDPDVIEGHNLFRFDLEYLESRAARYRLRLHLGRDGSELRARPSRMQIAERTISYRR